MIVPQSNPKAAYLSHKVAIDAAIARTLASGWYILGKEVLAFEAEFAAFHGSAHAIGVGNGTDALEISLRALGLRKEDQVFTVAHTAVATVAAIEKAGATPVLVDIDPQTFTMCPDSLESAIKDQIRRGGRPGAVIAVHLYGHPAALDEIAGICLRYGLKLIEDCAQAHGASLNGQKVGTFGDIAAFSFYPTKNLGALGDGGAIMTSDSMLAARASLLREYGWEQRYVSSIQGGNSRLDEIQAAILRVKLCLLDQTNQMRRNVAALYGQGIRHASVVLPPTGTGVTHACHQFVIRTGQRDSLRIHLAEHGIGTLIHYPSPIHLQPAYLDRIALAPNGLPQTVSAAAQVLSLPMFPELTTVEIEEVIQHLNTWSPASM